MTFSGALRLTDLNDFITPSQACIKPVEQSNRPQDLVDPGAASTEIRIDSSGSYYEVANSSGKSSAAPASRKLETAQISLNDCLACSGCITSAESVLITLQSHEEVLNVLSKNPPASSQDHRTTVLSIAPQSLASLAASVSSSSSTAVTLRQILHRVQAFAHQELGFDYVYDTTFARHIALLEHVQEFRERKQLQAQARGPNDKKYLPMLASACPGWVCYAEKTHPEMLPFIARGKSPQQVMGTLVKNWLGEKWGKKPNEIYHVTVMPCYDKKLEASRSDFYNDIYSTRDVDCVITTGELEILLQERGWDLSIPIRNEGSLEPINQGPGPGIIVEENLPELLTHSGTSSGSYLQTLVSDYLTKDTELTTRSVRSADYEEYIVTEISSGQVIFKGARCYGFRNLQNLVRKVGRDAGVQVGKGAAGRLAAIRASRKAASSAGGGGKGENGGYDYVEVMACPNGCINGGGQLKPKVKAKPSATEELEPAVESLQIRIADNAFATADTDADARSVKWGDREWTKKVEQTYWHDLPTPPPTPPLSPSPTLGSKSPLTSPLTASSSALGVADEMTARVLEELCKPTIPFGGTWVSQMDAAAEEARRIYFRTEYRAVESEVVGIQVQW